MVLCIEEVTMWQELAWLSSLRRMSSWTYRCPKNMGANSRLTSADIFMAKGKYKDFMAKWGWDPKKNLESQKATKTTWWAIAENLEEELTYYDNLAFPVILFFNSTSIAFSSGKSSMVAGSTSPRIGKSNWLATSSRVTVSSPQEKKNVWVVEHHR